MPDQTYDEAVVDTFRKRALRTAYIIDDQFPTYRELATTDDAKLKFKETDLAVQLYDLFHRNHIPCDVENVAASVKDGIERIRKSDLVVLDYHLGVGEDTRASIGLVRELSRTEHFNTIVLYTATPELDDVWLNLAIGLRGGWGEGSPVRTAEAVDALSGLVDGGVELPAPSRDMMTAFLLGRNLATAVKPEVDEFRGILESKGVDADLHDEVLDLRILEEVRGILGDDKDSLAATAQPVEGGRERGRPRWLQSGNCFVTIMGKRAEGSATAKDLLSSLDAALLEWRPNILQVLVSEIQNILELEALAMNDLHIREPHTQVSLCYLLLSAMSDDVAREDPAAFLGPVDVVLDKLVDGMRVNLLTRSRLRRLGGDLLMHEVGRLDVPTAFDNPVKRRQTLIKHAKAMSGRHGGDVDANASIMRLNAFLSTEHCRNEVTTGTVFTDGAEHWMCMTPACDMVDRPPKNEPDEVVSWRASLHPTKPIVAIRLVAVSDKSALKNAEEGRIVFARTGDVVSAFDTVPKGGLSHEFFFLKGKVAGEPTELAFSAARLKKVRKENVVHEELETGSFRIVAQLRANYASRFLQQTGQWLSRIGVDFVRSAT